MKVVPQLGSGHLTGMLGVEVLEDDVKGTAGNAKQVATE